MDNEALVLDFLTWINLGPKPYVEVMEAWRTSCPRLTIWEDAVDLGYVRVVAQMVEITEEGRQLLNSKRNVKSKTCSV